MKKNLDAIYIMHFINGFAGALVGIFIPIYLFKLNYSLSQVLIYYLIYGIAVFFAFVGAGYFSSYFGLRKAILAGFPFLFLYIGMLYALPVFSLPLYYIAIVNAIAVSLYWFPSHVFFAEYSSDKKMGSNVGKLLAFPQLAGIFAPLVGGAIATFAGFSILLIVAGAIFLISAIPLLWLPELSKPVSFSPSKFKDMFKLHSSYVSTEFVENIREEMEGIIWPIFIYLTFKNIFSIGILGSLLSAGSFFFMLLVGRYSDKMDKKIFLKIGALIMIVLWIVRYYAVYEIPIYILTLLAGFFGALILVPFSSIVFSLSRKDNIAEFIIFREIPVTLARIVIYSFALILISNINHLFLFTAFSNIFLLFF